MKILDWFIKIKNDSRRRSIAAVWFCYCLALVLGFCDFGSGWGRSKYIKPMAHYTVTTTKYKGQIMDMDYSAPRYSRGHHTDPFTQVLIQLLILGGWALSLNILDPAGRYKNLILTRYGLCVLLLIWALLWHFHFILLLSLLWLPFVFYGAVMDFRNYSAKTGDYAVVGDADLAEGQQPEALDREEESSKEFFSKLEKLDSPDPRERQKAAAELIRDHDQMESLIEMLDYGKRNRGLLSGKTVQLIRKKTVERLSRITGQNFGEDYWKWSDWWEENKKNYQ